jgi:hypothetical protein
MVYQMRDIFIIQYNSSSYSNGNSPYIYCNAKLASMLSKEGIQKLIRFTIKHEFDYYHNVKIIDEIFNNIKPYK